MVKALAKKVSFVDELKEIAECADGLLTAEDVVQWATEHPEGELYKKFEWDDTRAGYQYRLWQARMLIRRVMVTLEESSNEPVRAFVSLLEDRSQARGGYRLLVDVLEDAERQQALLKQALAEFKIWQRKYQQLKELAEIFKVAEKVLVETE